MTAWATELEFAYDHGHLYVLDAARHWSEAEVDVRMPRSANFFVPLRVEGWGGRPPLDLDALGPRRRVLADGAVREARARLRRRSTRSPSASPPAPTARAGAAATSARRRRGSASTRTRPTPTACRSGRARRGAARGDQALERLAARRARRPAGAAGRRGARRDRRDRRHASAPATALRIGVRLAGAGGRTWDRTIRADGVVRWVARSSRFDRVGAARRAPRPAAVRRRPRRALLPRPPRRTRSGSRTRCAPPTRRSPGATSPSRTS